MNRIKQSNKIFLIPILSLLILGLLFMPTILSMIKPEVKNLPLGLLLLDEGELVKTMAEKIPENAGDRISFEIYTSSDELEQALDEKEIYGFLVFPKDFSETLISLQGEKSEQTWFKSILMKGKSNGSQYSPNGFKYYGLKDQCPG